MLPIQLQLHGSVPLTSEAVPALQRLVVGANKKLPPLEEPQVPLTAGAVVVVTLNVPLTPPIVRVAVVVVENDPDEVKRTVIVSPLFTVPDVEV